MTIVGNILLIIATLIFLPLAFTLTKAPPGNDGAVGYFWGIIILDLLFSACMILVTLVIASKGGFEWVSATKSTRFWLVTLGLLSMLFTTGLSGLFKYEHGPVPFLIRFYSSFAPFMIPAVMIIAGMILVNSKMQASVPVAAYQWPLLLVAVIGVTGAVSAVSGFISESARNQEARVLDNQRQNDENHTRMLAEIDSCDVSKNMVFILVFTGDNQDVDVRDKAVAKVKTNPQWQQELIRLLQSDWAPEPLQFLSSNDVDDPSLFLEPVRVGVLNQARLIRQSIHEASQPHHLYADQFSWEVERVLRTVDRFKGKGVDYRPAVKEVRAALDEPAEFEKPKFRCISMLDKWIAANP